MYSVAGAGPCQVSQSRPSGTGCGLNGPSTGPAGRIVVTCVSLPSRPARTTWQASRNRLSLRCWLPVWRTRPRLLHRRHQPLALVDGQRQWLLAIDVLAGLECGEIHQRMPVVRRRVEDHVHVLAFEQLAEVLDSLRALNWPAAFPARPASTSQTATTVPNRLAFLASPIPMPPQPISPMRGFSSAACARPADRATPAVVWRNVRRERGGAFIGRLRVGRIRLPDPAAVRKRRRPG